MLDDGGFSPLSAERFTMAITDATWPWADRHSTGTLKLKNIYNMSFGYSETQKKIAAGTTTAILAATNGATAAQTITAGITNPDWPRALRVVPSANTTGNPLSIVINGYNVEGKPISSTFVIPIGSTTPVLGNKAFARVTSIVVPPLTSGLTFTVGTQDKLGIRHRLFSQNTTVKVYTQSTAYGAATLQQPPAVVANEDDIEFNLVTPFVAPNGSLIFTFAYAFDWWSDGTSFQDQPEYSTTTSTSSTSTSTSTSTITTSTSSTSTSTSSTSTSTSSTSTSTSSTSTSTTTTP